MNLWIETPYRSGVPGRGIRLSASVRPAGLTQGELVLRGKECLRPTASDTHQTWGGAIVGYFFVFGTCSASFVNHARQETHGINVSVRLLYMLDSTTQFQESF